MGSENMSQQTIRNKQQNNSHTWQNLNYTTTNISQNHTHIDARCVAAHQHGLPPQPENLHCMYFERQQYAHMHFETTMYFETI